MRTCQFSLMKPKSMLKSSRMKSVLVILQISHVAFDIYSFLLYKYIALTLDSYLQIEAKRRHDISFTVTIKTILTVYTYNVIS